MIAAEAAAAAAHAAPAAAAPTSRRRARRPPRRRVVTMIIMMTLSPADLPVVMIPDAAPGAGDGFTCAGRTLVLDLPRCSKI
jgi:hypothetical protein